MIKKYSSKNITWVDLEKPNRAEVRSLMLEYKLHPLVAEELLLPTLRPKVDLHPNFIYLILHFPPFGHSRGGGVTCNHEIDFIIGKDFLITARYEAIDSFQKLSKIFEVQTILGNEDDKHAGYLFFRVARQLYDTLTDELDYIEDLQEEIEKNIFNDNEKQMVKEISRLNHNLLDFKQAIIHHGEVLNSLETAGVELFGKDFSYYLKNINNKYRRVSHIVERNRENLGELRETNDSLLTTKQNETMKIFAILAFVTFPLSLVASIFGMNTTILPIVGIKGDFWYIMGGMASATGLMFWFFKYKKWF